MSNVKFKCVIVIIEKCCWIYWWELKQKQDIMNATHVYTPKCLSNDQEKTLNNKIIELYVRSFLHFIFKMNIFIK